MSSDDFGRMVLDIALKEAEFQRFTGKKATRLVLGVLAEGRLRAAASEVGLPGILSRRVHALLGLENPDTMTLALQAVIGLKIRIDTAEPERMEVEG